MKKEQFELCWCGAYKSTSPYVSHYHKYTPPPQSQENPHEEKKK